jgi:hypothetical protein
MIALLRDSLGTRDSAARTEHYIGYQVCFCMEHTDTLTIHVPASAPKKSPWPVAEPAYWGCRYLRTTEPVSRPRRDGRRVRHTPCGDIARRRLVIKGQTANRNETHLWELVMGDCIGPQGVMRYASRQCSNSRIPRLGDHTELPRGTAFGPQYEILTENALFRRTPSTQSVFRIACYHGI